jgi:glycosyltransferase involved in cell wall biosynthesis
MRVLHSCALLRPTDGIVNQMEWEQEAADHLGLKWHTVVFCPSSYSGVSRIAYREARICTGTSQPERLKAWVQLRWAYHRWLKSKENEVDLFILRHYVHDPFQLHFILNCAKPVALVHHTLEIPELESGGGLSGKIRATLERVIGKHSISASAATIGVTAEIVAHEKARARTRRDLSYVYPNGIRFSPNSISDQRGRAPELLFVASVFFSWHGLDLLLKAVSTTKEDFVLHLVGDVYESDLIAARADRRIVMHGRLDSRKIQELASRCWLGLSSFALWRKNMNEACTLKVREYLMMGLPVYSGHVDVFPSTFDYYRIGKPEMDPILRFAREMRSATRAEITSSSRAHIAKEERLRDLCSDLEREFAQ